MSTKHANFGLEMKFLLNKLNEFSLSHAVCCKHVCAENKRRTTNATRIPAIILTMIRVTSRYKNQFLPLNDRPIYSEFMQRSQKKLISAEVDNMWPWCLNLALITILKNQIYPQEQPLSFFSEFPWSRMCIMLVY